MPDQTFKKPRSQGGLQQMDLRPGDQGYDAMRKRFDQLQMAPNATKFPAMQSGTGKKMPGMGLRGDRKRRRDAR